MTQEKLTAQRAYELFVEADKLIQGPYKSREIAEFFGEIEQAAKKGFRANKFHFYGIESQKDELLKVLKEQGFRVFGKPRLSWLDEQTTGFDPQKDVGDWIINVSW